jgi:altronate hydrolase
LAGFAKHINVSDYILIGLGCEVNQAVDMIENQQLTNFSQPQRQPRVLTLQGLGGTQKTIEAGIKAILELLPKANEVRRTKQPISELILGTNCGGSDGNSGITANPALGFASDELVKYGGASVLAETTEIYGAEHLLTKRAKNEVVGKKLVERIRWWENYTSMLGAEINNNPAPGNIRGGLTTIYEKSLGAVAKGGTMPLHDVYYFAEQITEKGFVFMDTPGLDPVSVTGLAAGGCNIIVFTTGRGSCYGCKPSPSIKVATNTPMYEHMIDDMDLNAGVILEGASIKDVGMIIFEEMIEVASGKKTKSELHGVGEEEFAPWVLGPIL